MKDFQIKKLYYSISEVSKMLGLEQYVLRYWETEFEQLRPQKNRAGNRAYTEKDIEVIKLIKKLTREDRYTIPGARQVLGSMLAEMGSEVPVPAEIEELAEVAVEDEAGETALVDDLKVIRASLVDLLVKLDPVAAGTGQ
jgi:DNA-binding transcriptional MerR regulator